jgi:formylglycine-generating enzyme required for sulfatase activity
MRSRALLILVAGSIIALAACGQGVDYTLHISFPDEASKQDTAWLYLWALGPDAGACPELEESGVDPDAVTVYESLVLENPPSGPGILPDVPNGVVLFLVEGRTASDARILRGCAREEIKNGTVLNVRIELRRICTPGPEEIYGNGQDDDCDGLTDECESDLDCSDQDTCTLDLCVQEECHHLPAGDNIPCNDHDPCTLDDKCQLDQQEVWACTGTPKDCSHYGGACTRGACDPASGECSSVPEDDGDECDDGQYCTVSDACLSGECVGADRDCDDENACTRDECNEGQDRCENTLEPRPGEEGPMGDVTCSDGQDNDCDGVTDAEDFNCRGCTSDFECDDSNPCTTDSCASPDCVNTPVGDGTWCDDGLYCTDPDACMLGVCLGWPRDCGGSIWIPCREFVCVEEYDACEERTLPEGTACDDGDWCTVGETCQQGVCAGGTRDCDDDDPCTEDTCDPVWGRCDHTPVPGVSEGPVGDTSCFNGLDDDCDGQTDWGDVDCGCVPDCSMIECGPDWNCGTDCNMYCTQGEFCVEGARQCVAGYWNWIDPGMFTMGSPDSGAEGPEPGRNPDEIQHLVQLTRPFMILSVEVTQEFFELLMRYNPSSFASSVTEYPVENLTWHEAAQFCNRLSSWEGYPECYECWEIAGQGVECQLAASYGSPYDCTGYRLPTEAEWELAARAGTTGSTYNGTIPENLLGCEQPNSVLDSIAWFCGNSGGWPQPVFQKNANDYFLHDMLGNVSEWCHDGYGDYGDLSFMDPVRNPALDVGGWIITRGGSFADPASSCRAAWRGTREFYEKSPTVGFRPVRTVY